MGGKPGAMEPGLFLALRGWEHRPADGDTPQPVENLVTLEAQALQGLSSRSDYFTPHGLDVQKQLLELSISAFERALELTINRYNQGIASQAEVLQARTQL